jgi:ABC-2 type transport system ATP-binding protein
LRISGLENLIFFARLHGLKRKEAKQRAVEAIESVGLSEAARRAVGAYSHGMQKRLSVARTILLRPRILLVDEATHDLDPQAARRVRALVASAADDGAAVLWTTQRVEEIRNFADTVTLLQLGKVAFLGSVEQLLEQADLRRHLLHLDAPGLTGDEIVKRTAAAIGDAGQIQRMRGKDGEEFELIVASGRDLGEVLATIHAIGIRVLDCHSARTDVEEAFIAFTGDAS